MPSIGGANIKKNIFKVQKLEGVPHSKAMALNLLSKYVLQQ